MADGLLEGILGEGDAPEVEAPEVPTGAAAFAAAVAAIASKQDPQVARDTSAFLRDQSELLKVQKEQLKDEHALRISHLRNQVSEEKVRRFGLRLRVGFQLFLALVATAIGLGAALMVRDAVTSRQVVVDPIEVSANLATRVPGGKIIASGLLDELSRLQDASRASAATARGLTGAWAGDIRVDVPETGISIGEISRLLRQRFGHDVHVDGDLVEVPAGGLALTIRGTGVPPKTFSGGVPDLGKLTVAAAEYVYAKSQPGRWSAYLNGNGRFDEAIAFSRAATASADPAERPKLLNSWANALASSGGSTREVLRLHRAAVKLQPDYWSGYANVQNDLMGLADEEGAWKAGEEMRRAAGGRPGKSPDTNYLNWDYLTWNLKPWLDSTLSDAEDNLGVGTNATSSGPVIADIELRMHDADAAELALSTTVEDPNDPSGAAMVHHVRGRLALQSGDVAAAVTELEAYNKAYADPVVNSNSPGYQCWVALAEEAAGHPDKADALLNSAGTFVDCKRFRGDILDGRGDWAGAQKAYGEAVALAPDLPAAYYSWGVALLRHGDLAGAEGKFAQASQRGPHWADPLKVWGDVLAKQGKLREALIKYDEALKFAPNWKQLREARETVAGQKS